MRNLCRFLASAGANAAIVSLLSSAVVMTPAASATASPATGIGQIPSACGEGKPPNLNVCLGLALQPVKAESGQAIFVGGDIDQLKLGFFSKSPSMLTAEFRFDRTAVTYPRSLEATIAFAIDNMKPVTLTLRASAPNGAEPCTSDDPSISCTVADESLTTISDDAGREHKLWSGTATIDVTNSVLLHGDADKPVTHRVSGLVVVAPSATLTLCADQHTGKKLPAGCEDPHPEKAIGSMPVTVRVSFDPGSDGYAPKPNADTKKIFDGVAALVRSRIGLDVATDWSPWVRASMAFGQASGDQSSSAGTSGDAVFAKALQNKDVAAGAASAAGAVLDPSKKGDGSVKQGFLASDSDLLSFSDLSSVLSKGLSGSDVVAKNLKDTTAGVTPFDLSSLVAPDGAFKLVTRNDVPGQRGWLVRAGVIFDAAVGDDPGGVADGAGVVRLSRTGGGSTFALSLAHSFANRTQKLIDLSDRKHVDTVPLTPTVSIAVPYPVARSVHVVDEGIQLSYETGGGFSTYLRATGEPGRGGSDLYAAQAWRGSTRRALVRDPGSLTTTFAFVAGYRGTGSDYFAPIGTRNDLAGTYGPFYVAHRDSVLIAPGQRRESSLTLYQSRWASKAGIQQYVTRIDGQYDFRNRVGLTGSLTRSAASPTLITRQQVNFPAPLGREPLFPLNQGNAGLSWRPPNGELSLQEGYAFVTACKNIVGTTELPAGVTLTTGAVLPRCQPQGSNTLSGTAKVIAGRLMAAVHYGAPTFAVARTPDIGAAIERVGAIRYRIGKCHVFQAEYVNRSAYEGLAETAGSLWGASLALHNVAHLFGARQVVTLSYARVTSIPLAGVPQSKVARGIVPDLFHQPDDKGC